MQVKPQWDTEIDGTIIKVDLPEVVEVPEDISEDEIADWLTDSYGWCVFGWEKVDD